MHAVRKLGITEALRRQVFLCEHPMYTDRQKNSRVMARQRRLSPLERQTDKQRMALPPSPPVRGDLGSSRLPMQSAIVDTIDSPIPLPRPVPPLRSNRPVSVSSFSQDTDGPSFATIKIPSGESTTSTGEFLSPC